VISSAQKMLGKLYDVLVNHYKEITIKSKDITTYLGLGITVIKNNENSITIMQPTLVNKIMDAANLNDCKGISTPMSTIQTYNVV